MFWHMVGCIYWTRPYVRRIRTEEKKPVSECYMSSLHIVKYILNICETQFMRFTIGKEQTVIYKDQ